MNPKAREILRQPEEKSQPNTVGELVRYLSAGLRWAESGTSTKSHTTIIEYNAPNSDRFLMSIEMIDHFVLITIAPRAIELPLGTDSPACSDCLDPYGCRDER